MDDFVEEDFVGMRETPATDIAVERTGSSMSLRMSLRFFSWGGETEGDSSLHLLSCFLAEKSDGRIRLRHMARNIMSGIYFTVQKAGAATHKWLHASMGSRVHLELWPLPKSPGAEPALVASLALPIRHRDKARRVAWAVPLSAWLDRRAGASSSFDDALSSVVTNRHYSVSIEVGLCEMR